MTFPQLQQASQETREEKDFFRLYTALESGGDVYEIDTSAVAFVIGPQSDVARVRVTYFDPSEPNKLTSFVVSVDDPFLGRLDALLSSVTFPVSGTQARILVTPEDLYEPGWGPSVLAQDIVAQVAPKIDLLCYLNPPAGLPAKRADFTSRGRVTIVDNGGGDGTTYLVFPYYGRRYASFKITNFSGGALAGYTLDVSGINFTTDTRIPITAPSDYLVHDVAVVTAGAIAAADGATTNIEVKASTDGLFDYLLIAISGPAIDSAAGPSFDYLITFSDEEP